MTLYLSQALVQLLGDSGLPLVTEYDLYQRARPIVASGQYQGRKITRLPAIWQQNQLRAMIRNLVKRRVLAADDDFKAGVWRVVQAITAATAEEAICLVDPFAYISHLSAMQRYGITDRAPEALHLTTPARALWTRLRNERMARDYDGESPDADLPQLIRIGFHDAVRRRPVVLHETGHPADPAPIAGNASRIVGIGRVFVDMLDQPELCGGIHHVLDCFERHADTWFDDIVAAVDAFDSPIVKVRAGHILDERLDIASPAVMRWLGCAQRGGSRKLDPYTPYGSRYSEKWMIALNV